MKLYCNYPAEKAKYRTAVICYKLNLVQPTSRLKCKRLAGIMVMSCIMPHVWRHKLERFSNTWTDCQFCTMTVTQRTVTIVVRSYWPGGGGRYFLSLISANRIAYLYVCRRVSLSIIVHQR